MVSHSNCRVEATKIFKLFSFAVGGVMMMITDEVTDILDESLREEAVSEEESLLEAIANAAEAIEELKETPEESLEDIVEEIPEDEDLDVSIEYRIEAGETLDYWEHLGTYQTTSSAYQSMYEIEEDHDGVTTDSEIITFRARMEMLEEVKGRRVLMGDMLASTEDYSMANTMTVSQREKHAVDRRFTYNFILNTLNYDVVI